jgi:hypothetical protein
MVIRLMDDPEEANKIFKREGITWKEYYKKKLDAAMEKKEGGSKRKPSKRNNASKRKTTRRNKTLRGGKDKGIPSEPHSVKATISQRQLYALGRANMERLEQERLAQERARLARTPILDDLLNRQTGTQRQGPTALDVFMAAQGHRTRQ